MQFYLLIIPIGLLVAVGLCTYGLVERGNVIMWRLRLKHIDNFVASLMKEDDEHQWLQLAVARRVTYVHLDFEQDTAYLLVPLLTQSQIKHKNKLFKIVEAVDPGAELVDYSGGPECIKATLTGTPSDVAAQISQLFLLIFDVDDKRRLELVADARRSDLLRFKPTYHEMQHKEIKGRKWPATTDGRDTFVFSKPPAGFFKFLAGYVLIPLPFVMAYYQFGFVAACVAYLAVLGLITVFWIVSGRSLIEPVPGKLLSWPIAIGCALVTALGEPRFLQSAPTLISILLAVYTVTTLPFGHAWFDIKGPRAKWLNSARRWWITLAVAMMALFTAAANEAVSIFASLDTWVWYFAYLRLDVVLFLLVTSMPISLFDQPEEADWPTRGTFDAPGQ